MAKHPKALSFKERQKQLREDPIERRKMFERLLKHVEAGFSIDSFAEITKNSLQEWFKTFPDEINEEELTFSLKKGMHMWENIGKKQSTGECLGNSQAWRFNMGARYGWSDKIDLKAEHSGSIAVSVVSYASQQAEDREDT